MAKCELSIELDHPREVFHPGDEVTGHVVVQTDGDMRCDGLVVELNWATHGRGSVASGEAQTLQLFEGEWTGPTNARYAFSFVLPDGPVTYRGHYLNVGWFLRTRADVPWKIDPKAEVELILASGPASHQKANWERQFAGGFQPELAEVIAEVQQEDSPHATGAARRKAWDQLRQSPGKLAIGCGCVGLFLLPFVFLLGFLIWDGVAKARVGDWVGAIPGMFATAFVLFVLLGILYAIITSRMLRDRFGTIEQTVEPDRAGPGEPVSVRVTFTPRKDTVLNRAIVTLRGVETVVSGSGTNQTTRRHTVYEEVIEMEGERRMMARQPVVLETEVVLPATAPPSFDAPRNSLRWTLATHLDIARFPDWAKDRSIVIVPE